MKGKGEMEILEKENRIESVVKMEMERQWGPLQFIQIFTTTYQILNTNTFNPSLSLFFFPFFFLL